MIETIHHIVRISARRDRTEINAALMYAIEDLFHPPRAVLYQCYAGVKRPMVFDCAGFDGERAYVRNAYLPDRQHCTPIDTQAHLRRCWREGSITLDPLGDGLQRLVFPVGQNDPLYLIDITLPETFAADDRVALMGLIEYFGNHIALLNYGEADTLTGLANRKTFEKHLFELLGRANDDRTLLDGSQPQRRQGNAPDSSHWLAVCDIDRFKSINDNFGHLIGDEVLILMSQVMRRAFRFDDQIFRFGGEEFVVVLQPANRASATETLNRFREAVAQQIFSRVGHVTISIGFSALRPYDTPNDVIDRADEALYYAKQHGRNRVDCYEALVEQGELAAKELPKGEVELF